MENSKSMKKAIVLCILRELLCEKLISRADFYDLCEKTGII